MLCAPTARLSIWCLPSRLSHMHQSHPLQDPHVDQAYNREEMLAGILQAQKSAEANQVDELASRVEESLSLKSVSKGKEIVVTGTLSMVIRFFPKNLRFEPENEDELALLNKLPDELLVIIIRNLDHTSVERFAAVNRKARILSLDSVIWRYAYLFPIVCTD
jgi:F-box protein 9